MDMEHPARSGSVPERPVCKHQTSILQLAVLVQASSFFRFASSPFLIILPAR